MAADLQHRERSPRRHRPTEGFSPSNSRRPDAAQEIPSALIRDSPPRHTTEPPSSATSYKVWACSTPSC
eukprot:1309294-Heterocapsa_arctica.AAC.1